MSLPQIELRPITRENFVQCSRLSVAPGQEYFVDPNALSIAETKYFPDWEPMAVHADGQMVGFLMWGQEPEGHPSVWSIIRIMIDQRYQGRGYGRASFREAVARLRAKPGISAIELSFTPTNEIAKQLYLSEEFSDTGRLEKREVVYRLEL